MFKNYLDQIRDRKYEKLLIDASQLIKDEISINTRKPTEYKLDYDREWATYCRLKKALNDQLNKKTNER